MKYIIFLGIYLGCSCTTFSQTENPFNRAFQIKIDPTELAYIFPRFGIGVEQKFNDLSVWTSFHFGWDFLSAEIFPRYYDGAYDYWGMKAGLKKTKTSSSGEYFFGPQIQFDEASAFITDDVFYTIKTNQAVLYDRARFHRSRISLFLENGYEIFIGNRFSIEFSGGFGIRRIERWYSDIENPLILNDVKPLTTRLRNHYKYAFTIWKPAFTGGIKMGIRI